MRNWAFLGIVWLCALSLGAQAVEEIEHTQRYDIRRSEGKRYIGMFFGFTRAFWLVGAADGQGKRPVEARYYLSQESTHDISNEAQALQADQAIQFTINADGRITLAAKGIKDFTKPDIPLFREYPERPPADVAPGQTWRSTASITVDPLGNGHYTRIPLYIEYRNAGTTNYGGKTVIQVTGRFALRYLKDKDPPGDPELRRAEGSRELTAYFDAETGYPVFMRERVENQHWIYTDGKDYVDNGFILTFWKGGVAYTDRGDREKERQREREEVIKKIDLDIPETIQYRDDERGLALILHDLKFESDKAVLLAGEESRLDALYQLLVKVDARRNFMVIGHTANVGTAQAQNELSEQRAKVIVDALIKRGLLAKRLSYIGKGSTEPVGDNTTDLGRAANRRVEVIITD